MILLYVSEISSAPLFKQTSQEPALCPSSTSSVYAYHFLSSISVSALLRWLTLSFPPFLPHIHCPPACRILTAGCVYHPLSQTEASHHMAGWQTDLVLHFLGSTLPAAQFIQLAWLSVETSGILITKMMYFNPTNSIQRAKALMIYVRVCAEMFAFFSGIYF